MSDYETAIAAWNRACDMIRALEVEGRRVPDSWLRRERELYREAAAAERAAAPAQGALFGEGVGRRWS